MLSGLSVLKVTTGMPAASTRSITGASASVETEEIARPSILPISVSISLIWPSASAPDRADELGVDLVLGLGALATPAFMNGANSLETSW